MNAASKIVTQAMSDNSVACFRQINSDLAEDPRWGLAIAFMKAQPDVGILERYKNGVAEASSTLAYTYEYVMRRRYAQLELKNWDKEVAPRRPSA